jgi:hypothetical protein
MRNSRMQVIRVAVVPLLGLSGGASAQQNVDRTILPIREPERPTTYRPRTIVGLSVKVRVPAPARSSWAVR